ncbi:MAG TPA: glycoside hydrolase family 44 protein [Bryobacteraceae bacterium]|nr:glycoside hydrolase family 44 protein [Bryobacteraceae bacterium]
MGTSRLAAVFSVLACALPLAAQSNGPALSVDAAAANHPISPDIYGINDYSDQGLANELHITVRRWGGDATTRYNWQLDSYNAAADWYYEDFPAGDNAPVLPDGSKFNQVMELSRRTGSRTIGTIPMIGWIAASRSPLCSFAVAKYGAQQKTDPYNPKCGNGLTPAGNNITGNNPHDANMPVDVNFMRQWVNYLVKRYGRAEQGGVAIYSLDNEPTIWLFVHRDVHPQPPSYDEMRDVSFQYAAMIKAADPSALVSGPALSGWDSFFYSAVDWLAGWNTAPYQYFDNPVDRNAHGGIAFVDWYLQQMRGYEQQHGKRILDYLDLHAYVLPDNVGLSPAGDAATQALRLASTRVLWDPAYQYPSTDIREPVRLIPRMRDWVHNNYPGTRIALTEYNWGGLEDINGALAQADVLGIFGRESLDLATMWGPPSPDQPGAFAFRMYRNYDGIGGAFGETSVQASSADQSKLAVYAAKRSDSALTLMAINKTAGDLTTQIALANFQPTSAAQVWNYSKANLAAIVRQPDLPVSPSGFNTTFPANSITLLVLPAAPATLAVPPPVINAVVNAASYGSAVSPGLVVAIFGQGLGPSPLASGTVSAAGMVGTSAGGVRILFDGFAAPVLYASDKQAAAVVPYEAALHPTTHVQVEYRGSRSAPFEVALSSVAPGIFAKDASGRGQAAAINQDQTINSALNPAPRGSIVSIYATGEGVTNPPGVDGQLALAILPRPQAAVSTTIGGVTIQPEYAGAAGGAIAGALQVNVRIPDSVAPSSAVPVTIQIGGTASQANITIAVK